MMNYEEFVNSICEKLGDVLPEKYRGAKITVQQVDKLQGDSYLGVAVLPEGECVATTYDVSKAYEYLCAGASFEEVLRDMADAVAHGSECAPKLDAEDLLDYETVKKSLMVQLVSTDSNREMLLNVPHTEYEDMSLVYRIAAFTENGAVTGSCLVNNNMLKMYGITVEQLHKDALENASVQFPATIRPMREVIAEMMGISKDEAPVGDTLYVLTCNGGVIGSGCLFYPDMFEMIADTVLGNYYILPSSIHEVLILLDDGSMPPTVLERMVREINSAEVQPCDRLTDSVYYYDCMEREFYKVHID